MKNWIILGVYVVGYLTTARVIYISNEFDARHGDRTAQTGEDAAFVAVVVSFIWPLLLALALAVLPFLGVGWLISRPTRAHRVAMAEQRARDAANEWELPYPKSDA